MQLSSKLLVCGTMAPFICYEQLSELVKMHHCLYNKQEKYLKKEVKQRAWKEIAKELDLKYGLPDVFYIDVAPKLMMPEAVSDVCMHLFVFTKEFFFLSLVIISVWWEWVGDIKISSKKCRYNLGTKVAIVLISIFKNVSPGGNQA